MFPIKYLDRRFLIDTEDDTHFVADSNTAPSPKRPLSQNWVAKTQITFQAMRLESMLDPNA